MKKLEDKIKSELNILTKSGLLTPEQFLQVVKVFETAVREWNEEVAGTLKQMAMDWELTMGDTDESFYSLGLRRAQDVITGSPALEQLPVLETEDTPTPYD